MPIEILKKAAYLPTFQACGAQVLELRSLGNS